MKVKISGVEHTIPPKTTNKSLTSLSLMGDDSYNYGSNLLENLIQLNEHFHNSESPSNPIDGQLYYNGNDLKLYHSNDWHDIVDLPLKETLDIIYLDDNPNNVSGASIDSFLTNLIPLSGYTKSNLDIILPDSNPSDQSEAVTKKYVDKTLSYPNLFNLVPNTGSPSMAGPIKLTDVDTSDSDLVAASVQFVKDMGLLDVYSDNKKPEKYRISTYRLIDRADESSSNYKDYFTTVWYQATIPAYEKSIEIQLPVAFTDATTTDNYYDYSMIVNCSPVEAFDILSVEITSNKSFKIYRADSVDDLLVQGTVMGFTDKSGKGAPYDICPLPTPIPTPEPTPTPAPVVPEVSPTPEPTPSPSASLASSPVPTPSPSVSAPTPSPSPSGSMPGPSPSPSKSGVTTKLCFDTASAAKYQMGTAYYVPVQVINGVAGNITVDYDPKGAGSADTFKIQSGGFTTVQTDTLAGVASTGTLTWPHTMSTGGYVTVVVDAPSNTASSWDDNWSFCVNYAGGIKIFGT